MVLSTDARKLWVAILAAVAVYLTAYNTPGFSNEEALVTFIPTLAAALGVYIAANSSVASAKFYVALLGALATGVVTLVQQGWDNLNLAAIPFAVAVIGAGSVWLAPQGPSVPVEPAVQ